MEIIRWPIAPETDPRYLTLADILRRILAPDFESLPPSTMLRGIRYIEASNYFTRTQNESRQP
jgi:hypothetical protein